MFQRTIFSYLLFPCFIFKTKKYCTSIKVPVLAHVSLFQNFEDFQKIVNSSNVEFFFSLLLFIILNTESTRIAIIFNQLIININDLRRIKLIALSLDHEKNFEKFNLRVFIIFHKILKLKIIKSISTQK